MNIKEVIAQFEIEHKGKYSKEDYELITTAVHNLGLTDFSIKYRSDLKRSDGSYYSIYFYDESNLIHIHPTMIVAKCEFDGFQPGRKSKYLPFPYMAELSNWTTEKDACRPICPHCFVEIPLVGQCGMCGFDPDDIDDESLPTASSSEAFNLPHLESVLMKPRNDNPALYRENVYKSWKIMARVVANVDDECLVAHLEPNPGVGYDCLSLITKDESGQLRTRFMLNRNGVNSNVLDRVWDRFDQVGCDQVAEEIVEASGLQLSRRTVSSAASIFCNEVVAWIENHSKEEFCVGPIGWPGGCRTFLELARGKHDETTWLIPDHGPELCLGIGGVEKERILQNRVDRSPQHSHPETETASEIAPIDDKFFAYLYRNPKSLRIRYVGYATNPSRAFTDGHNEEIGKVVKGGEYLEILIAGPYRDEAEARNVEAALVSAIQPDLNLIQQPGIKFYPLGVPSELGDRRFKPALDVHEIGRLAGGALVVYCDLSTPLHDGISKVSPTNFSDDVVFTNIQDHWRVKDFIQGWISNPETTPKLLVAVQGPPKDRIIIGAAQIDAGGWASTPVAPDKDYLHRIPLDKSAGLDNAELRGRKVSVKFNSGPPNIIMYIDNTGLVLHGYKLKGKSAP